MPHFREFRVGLATQHGYYPWLGDYIHPDRKTWQAMRGDKQGAAEMSFDKMRASLASPQWREHLLQQAQWILEILKPDAITVDETFAGLGYDYHPEHAGPTSAAAIDCYRKLRALVRSFGNGKAVFTSDCSMSGFLLWADGECGDHAYDSLLGHLVLLSLVTSGESAIDPFLARRASDPIEPSAAGSSHCRSPPSLPHLAT